MCIDDANSHHILQFLQTDSMRITKFRYIVELILLNKTNSEQFKKEADGVFAMIMFKGGQNIRIYCKEQKGENGTCFIIASELLEKKKNQRNSHAENSLIQTVKQYEYDIRPQSK